MSELNPNFDPGRPRYMISVAAELVGMHPQTLRIYEQKGLVRPKRTAGNTRLYSDDDVQRLDGAYPVGLPARRRPGWGLPGQGTPRHNQRTHGNNGDQTTATAVSQTNPPDQPIQPHQNIQGTGLTLNILV